MHPYPIKSFSRVCSKVEAYTVLSSSVVNWSNGLRYLESSHAISNLHVLVELESILFVCKGMSHRQLSKCTVPPAKRAYLPRVAMSSALCGLVYRLEKTVHFHNFNAACV